MSFSEQSSSEQDSSGSGDELDEYGDPYLDYLLRGRVDGGLLVALSDVAALAQWLKVHCPRDVLMPAVRTEKRPGFAHAGGAWTWARFDWAAQTARAAQYDCGLLLFDLCVIDCDTVEVADALEAAWPELTAAPVETTARGRHYYLARSAKADTHGYYDGAAQRQSAVDFKSRTWGGTSGFVVTAPSTNKAWVRSPWAMYPDGGLPEISDALLDAVAAPRHPPLRCALRFAAEDPDALPLQPRASPFLAQCSYITGLLDLVGGADTSASDQSADSPPEVPFPEQFSRQDVTDLLRVVEGRDPEVTASPDPADVAPPPAWLASGAACEARHAELAALADFLGAPAAALAPLRAACARGGRNRGDWLRVDVGWGASCVAAQQAAERGELLAVDAALADTLRHTPLLPSAPHDHRWLMHAGPRCRSGVPPGAKVLADDPAAAAAAALPRFVRAALRAEAGHLALAGGAALAAVCAPSCGSTPSDYDLFVYGFSGEASAVSAAADALARRVALLPGVVRGGRGIAVSRSAITFRVTADAAEADTRLKPGAEYIVQIVLRVATSPADILGGFDLAPVKVALLYDEEIKTATPTSSPADSAAAAAPQLRVVASPEWAVALRHGAFAVDGRQWSRATALRVLKYLSKDFDALIPALTDRARVRRTADRRAWWRSSREQLSHLDGFELLFALERHVSTEIEAQMAQQQRAWWPAYWVKRDSARVQRRDVTAAARLLLMQQRADYGSALKAVSALAHALRSAHASVLRAVFGAGPRPLEGPLGWRQPWSRAQFHPVAADVLDALTLADAAEA